jgi:type IV pilus assembly protein PilC
MTSYKYKAIDQFGRYVHSQIEVANEADLESRLAAMGLDLIKFKTASKLKFWRTKVSQRDLLMFCFQLEQLITAGIPLLEALRDLCASTRKPYFKKIIAGLLADVEGGKLLSQALSANPTVFSPVFVSLIAAGEKTGELGSVLSHLCVSLKWQDELLAQTKRLLMYPLILLLVVSVAVVVLMVYLVPEMVRFLQGLGQELPWNTQLLLNVSNVFTHYWWLMLMLFIALGITLILIFKLNDSARYYLDFLKLKLPLTGPILHKIIMARFAHYLALMYQTGIPLLDAIKASEVVVANRVVARALAQVHTQINAGMSMSLSFEQADLFPPLVVRMIKVGEQTGYLDKSLLNVSYFYNRDVDDMMQNLLRLLEPLLTIILGLVLMFIMAAVLLPVYDSFRVMTF